MTSGTLERLLLAGLIAVTVAFGVGVLPLGIDEGYASQGPGLSPRAMPQLAVSGIALALAFGLVQELLGRSPAPSPGVAQGGRGAHPFRALGAVLICFLFAYLGFQLLGFYLGGVVMAILLTLLLGERHVFKVVVIPILILALIYGIFELGFQIRLPKAGFIPGLPL